MDFLTQVLLAVVYVLSKIANSTLEAVGERIANNSIDRFLELLKQRSEETVIAIREQPVESLDYERLFEEVKLEAQNNPQFVQTTQELVSTAQEHPLPNMDDVLDNFTAIEELKPRIAELRSFINIWSKKMVNVDEVKKFLPDATDKQAQRYTTQLKRSGELESFFAKYAEDLNGYQDLFARAKKAFKYKQPYRIAVIGTAGAGKSTMLNAMLGRELVLTKSITKSATGAALEIFLDVSEDEKEEAVVTYRDKDNIIQLVYDHLVQRYTIDPLTLNGEIDDNFFEQINSLQYSGNDDEARKEFEKLCQIVIDLGEQYVNNDLSNLKTNFSLSNGNDFKQLIELIDENSDLNRDIKQRRIGLVKSVTYHIRSDKNSNGMQTLQLPNNVCLVDLPGLDGSLLHDIIISEGIKDADAVIFIMRPPRILGRGDEYLLDRVSKYISLQGKVESGERIFLVLNDKDSLMTDDMKPILRDVETYMDELMTKLLPNYASSPLLNKRGGDAPYFMASAKAAYYAQKNIKGNLKNYTDYENIKSDLRVKDGSDEEVLEVSQVPKLVEELTKFARDKRIEGQIRDGKQALDSIINPLYSKYEIENREMSGNQTSNKNKVENQLVDRKKRLKEQLAEFRDTILEELKQESKFKEVKSTAQSICNQVDQYLQQQMPNIWEKYFTSGLDRLANKGKKLELKTFHDPVLTDAQTYLWYRINQLVPGLATYLVQSYKEQFEEKKIAELIFNECGGSISNKIQELQSTIDKAIEKMIYNMEKVSQRIAMTTMTDPTHYFSNRNEDETEGKQTLLRKINEITPQQRIPTENFEDFVQEIRQLYETHVVDDCVYALLNLYTYELISIEDDLFRFIDNIFYDIRDNGDPHKITRFLSTSDSELQRMQLIEAKLTILSSIKE